MQQGIAEELFFDEFNEAAVSPSSVLEASVPARLVLEVSVGPTLSPFRVSLLAHQFQGGPPPGAPYPDCGPDSDPTSSLVCGPNACP